MKILIYLYSFEKIENINKKFNHDKKGKTLLKNINLNIYKNNKLASLDQAVRKNTLIDIICGFQKLNHGIVESDGKPILSNLEDGKNMGYILKIL